MAECFPKPNIEAYIGSKIVEEIRTPPREPNKIMLVYVISIYSYPRLGHYASLAEAIEY